MCVCGGGGVCSFDGYAIFDFIITIIMLTLIIIIITMIIIIIIMFKKINISKDIIKQNKQTKINKNKVTITSAANV